MPPVGKDGAGAVGEETAHKRAHGRSDSTNDAVTLASPLVLESAFSDERSNRLDDSWGQPLMVCALNGSVWSF